MKIAIAIVLFLVIMSVFIWAYKFTEKKIDWIAWVWIVIWSAILPIVLIVLA